MGGEVKVFIMSLTLTIVLLGVLAFVVTTLVYPLVLRYAKSHNIVDNPHERKLQRVPVPVMGGIAFFIGIAVATAVAVTVFHYHILIIAFVAMIVMLVIGTMDDIKDLPATLRFIIEIVVIWLMMYVGRIYIDDFHGLWGLQEVDVFWAMPLSIIAGVGILNAINLVDGVDGYCSGYGIFSCSLFGILFFNSGLYMMGCFAIICACAIIPFFFHNVFGKSSKMFMGDGGSLTIGMVLTFFVFCVLSKSSDECAELAAGGVGLIPFCLAVLGIPVFDTLRVMSMRILRGLSPFSPDKTHLHHIFIEMGFSHVGTTASILMMNIFIVAVWFLSYKLGASIDLQFYIVVILDFCSTWVFYRFMKKQQNGGPRDEDGFTEGTTIWKFMCHLGDLSHMERGNIWMNIQKALDDTFLGLGMKTIDDE